MDWIEIALIGIPSFFLMFIVIAAFLIYRRFGKKEVVPMNPVKKQMKEIEEISTKESLFKEEFEEPDVNEIETVEEGESEESEELPKSKNQPIFCMVVVEGGKAYRGEYLGEEPQLVPLQNNQLIKVDSFWLLMKTEKVPLMKINRKHIILVAFENLPSNSPQKKEVQKSREVRQAEEAIESIDVD